MTNKLYTGDNLHFLHRFDSESVDLIYLDPPFNSKRTYSAPIGSKAAGSSFKDMWTWQDIDEQMLENLYKDYPLFVQFIDSIKALHGVPMMSYCLYMTQRLIELHRVLKKTGSIYLHCDPTASHYLKIIMDRVFGEKNFRNEIAWCYSGPSAGKNAFAKKHDVIFFYAKSEKTTFNTEAVKIPHKRQTPSTGRGMASGQRTLEEIRTDEIKQLKAGKKCPDWWDDIGSGAHMPKHERTGYPTQKPLKLLHRIIKASSTEGDLVLDPFCGCATTCVAAQQLGRKWIGIDIEKQAVSVLIQRLSDDAKIFADFIHTDKLPERTDIKVEADSASVRQKLYISQKGKCNGCGTEFEPRHFELDHIIPKSKGGSDTESNYQLLCGNCNRIKGTKPMEYLRMRIAQIDQALATQITFGD